MEEIKVAELFAGVGGFRIGLERASPKFNIVWSNQWEPATRAQVASEIYVKCFGEKGHSNEDIAKVHAKDVPDHNLLVGGFPCQDYSVAKTLRQSSGIQGKKGVLWWEIKRIVEKSSHRPEFLLLENVDRLLKSPSTQRGRDFAIILASLSDLGYVVEWRIINAAEYGMPQRRRRVFIMAYLNKSVIYKKISKIGLDSWFKEKGTLARAFPISQSEKEFTSEIEGDLLTISDNFNKGFKNSPFENAGIMKNRRFITAKVKPHYEGKQITLGDVLLSEKEVPESFFINGERKQWEFLKGAKKEKRYNAKRDFHYHYAEGSMIFPDKLDAPSRTIVTGEGGSSPSRFKHVIKTESGRYRRLTPVELERLNMFPDNHTEGCSDVRRAFLMGNALVIGVIEKIGAELVNQIKGKFN
ncbi:MAG: DNA (cytosine-5-)-methyltransferase [Candidatus Woesearchaeota archaeon]